MGKELACVHEHLITQQMCHCSLNHPEIHSFFLFLSNFSENRLCVLACDYRSLLYFPLKLMSGKRFVPLYNVNNFKAENTPLIIQKVSLPHYRVVNVHKAA